MMAGKRLEYIDMLKGLGILCITLLHFEDGIFPNWLNSWIGNFMITCFYFTAGWVLATRPEMPSTKQAFRKRLTTIGVPYIWFAILITIFDVLLALCGIYDWDKCLADVYGTVTLRGIGTLWFLPALFGAEIIFVWLMNNRNGRLLTMIAVFVVGVILSYYHNGWRIEYRELATMNKIIDAPVHTLVCMLTAWPVVASGYICSKKLVNLLSQTRRSNCFVLGVIFTVFTAWLIGFSGIPFGVMATYVYSLLASIGWVLLFRGMEHFYSMRFFSFWGRNSLILMVTHYSFLLAVCRIVNSEVLGHEQFKGYVTLLYFVATILLEYPIVYFFNTKARFMLGKR